MYTCQCKKGYGLENCTKIDEHTVDLINAGVTFCQSHEEYVNMEASPKSSQIIFVDHVAYGRPFFMEGSRSHLQDGADSEKSCPREIYANTKQEVRRRTTLPHTDFFK